MENQPPFQQQQNFNMQVPLPNATAVLVLGIIAIVGCLCYSFPGLICGIIALILASKDMKLYQANPGAYTLASLSNLKSGRICAIIGLSLSIIYLVVIVVLIATFGIAALSDPQHWMQNFNH